MGLPGSKDSLTIGWAVSTQYQRVTDRETDSVVWLTHAKNWTDGVLHRRVGHRNVYVYWIAWLSLQCFNDIDQCIKEVHMQVFHQAKCWQLFLKNDNATNDNQTHVIQEGWLSPTSVSAISLRHILASPGYAPWTIAVNVTWWKEDSMLVKRIAAYTHLSSTVYEL